MSVPYKKIRTSNIYKEETSLSLDSSKSLLEQTKVQVLNSQKPKTLSTQKAQEAYIVIDLKVSKALNKENTDLEKNDDALFISANNMYTELEDFSADNPYIKNNNNLDANNVNEQTSVDMNLDSHIKINQSQIKTETAEKESTKDTSKKLNNSLLENHIIDTNIIVDLLTTLYDNSKVAKSSFQLVMSKKKHKSKAKVSNAERNKVMSLNPKKNPGLRTKRS
ncbi:17871_t:CDS:2 [Cetraspora pellucida]|uniref:17871_t:CDS:1 n=1 Tax=Cetraspora pellucida TaxID=1433469 RepID=A0A9N9JSC4_9GLOM|nr:17871_t:CDS:2 [Cetraspora pellucida]